MYTLSDWQQAGQMLVDYRSIVFDSKLSCFLHHGFEYHGQICCSEIKLSEGFKYLTANFHVFFFITDLNIMFKSELL